METDGMRLNTIDLRRLRNAHADVIHHFGQQTPDNEFADASAMTA